MHLEHRRSIATPQEFAFNAASDFARFEREGAGGAKFTRINGTGVELGSEWRVEADFRGRMRRFNVRLTGYDPHERIEFSTGSSKFDVRVTYAFTATGAAQCEMEMSIDTGSSVTWPRRRRAWPRRWKPNTSPDSGAKTDCPACLAGFSGALVRVPCPRFARQCGHRQIQPRLEQHPARRRRASPPAPGCAPRHSRAQG